ncbi:MAG: hypothetical protein NWR72_08505 [Bacteroidia bacterium]|nr:hypothetical protein [Bacteroidia bacterium]
MRYLSFFVLFALLFASACNESESTSETPAEAQPVAETAPAPRAPRDQTIEEPGLASPESVIGQDGFYYVSNVGKKLEPSKKDGDGFISKLDTAGKVVDLKFMKGLDAPKGSAIVDGTFYVADIDKVAMYDLATGERKGEVDLSAEKTIFLNDLVAGPAGTLFVSSTDKSKIYQINLADGTYAALATSAPVMGPNGLWYDADANHLYVVTFLDGANGKAGRLDLNTTPATYELLDGYLGSLDGLVKIGDYLVTSDWATQSLVILDIANGGTKVGEHPMSLRIQGPADFYYDAATQEFWVPGMQMNKIFIKTSALK